jgi:hypothetical protein
MLMRESLEGVSVAATRQKAGSFFRASVRENPGKISVPGATVCAIVIVVPCKLRDFRLSQGLAAGSRHADVATRARVTSRTVEGIVLMIN